MNKENCSKHLVSCTVRRFDKNLSEFFFGASKKYSGARLLVPPATRLLSVRLKFMLAVSLWRPRILLQLIAMSNDCKKTPRVTLWVKKSPKAKQKLHFHLDKVNMLHVITYGRKFFSIINSSIFALSVINKEKTCIYHVEIASRGNWDET